MMSMNVKDYLRIYDDFLDEKTCKSLIKKIKKANWELHTFYQFDTGEHKSFDKDLSVYYDNASSEAAEVQNKIWFAVERYILKDHSHMKDWFAGWQGYTKVRYNRYNSGTQMRLHCDHIHSMFDGNIKGVPILSVLGSLNDNYSGGELVFWGQEIIELKAGQIAIFPSNFMYPHEVKLVTKGTRYSFVSWVW